MYEMRLPELPVAAFYFGLKKTKVEKVLSVLNG
jgi:hypothetical protein